MRAPESSLPSCRRSNGKCCANLLLKGLLYSVLLHLSLSAAQAVRVTAHTGEITLPTYGWAASKHPYFRGTDAVNIYPYPMLDFLSRDKTNRTYRTVVLENEYLRITFLPELGGKIHEVLDKTTGQPVFYVNHVIKPGLIGQCGAWTSGGVEWNTGPQGHTVSCMQPVDVVILEPEKDGARSVAIGETERIYRTKWTVIVTLRPGRSYLEERVRIYNPTETIRPYYFWNCTAVPNTPGFRFIYPMALGCDHAGEKFFDWPMDHGKDLTRGSNYQDAASIFAWNCDQDFFGSYNDDLGRGVVAYANHHQLPGKKAWTWGQGGFGKMHQMDLTDDDGPYNEVQTGPLLTQAQVGRLDPNEAVEWKEWWYPIHGIGGFTFANRDLAVNAAVEKGKLRLLLQGTRDLENVTISAPELGMRDAGFVQCNLSPRRPTEVALNLGTNSLPLTIEIFQDDRLLAKFRAPLELPARQPPEKTQPPQSATALAQAGWQDFLFARFNEAETKFQQALEKDPESVSAKTGRAYLKLDSNPTLAASHARAALKVDPDCGLARFALAVAEARLGNNAAALEAAWKSSLDAATSVAGRALAAKQLIRLGQWGKVIAALSEIGPWQSDPVCRNLFALACFKVGDAEVGLRMARASLEQDPLDDFAASLIALNDPQARGDSGKASRQQLGRLASLKPEALIDLLSNYEELNQNDDALWIFEHQVWAADLGAKRNPLMRAWADCLGLKSPQKAGAEGDSKIPGSGLSANDLETSFPSRYEDLRILQRVASRKLDGPGALCLGNVLFHLGRHSEGRELWKRAIVLGGNPAIACRALGMAAKTLDHDLKSARQWLEQANQADPEDAVIARDLAHVLFALADQTDSDLTRRELVNETRDRLRAAFKAGQGRSDFIALLARAQNRLNDFAATAQMLDNVRVTIWEGAHEVHDLFEEAHLALGEGHLKAGRAADALIEFDRALEYPANLATGRLENAVEGHIHYARGEAFRALGRKNEAAAAWRLSAEAPESKNAKVEAARKKALEALKSSAQ